MLMHCTAPWGSQTRPNQDLAGSRDSVRVEAPRAGRHTVRLRPTAGAGLWCPAQGRALRRPTALTCAKRRHQPACCSSPMSCAGARGAQPGPVTGVVVPDAARLWAQTPHPPWPTLKRSHMLSKRAFHGKRLARTPSGNGRQALCKLQQVHDPVRQPFSNKDSAGCNNCMRLPPGHQRGRRPMAQAWKLYTP